MKKITEGQVVRRCKIVFDMKHKIEDNGMVVDKICLSEHVHKNVELEVMAIGGEWIDFKELKALLLEALGDLPDNGMYNFGLVDSETAVRNIGREMCAKLERDVEIHMQETAKYSVSQYFLWTEMKNKKLHLGDETRWE